MKMSTLVVVVTLLTAAGARGGEAEASAKKVSELRKERIATLKDVVETGVALFREGHFEIRDVSEARLALLKAELDVAEKESDRIALYTGASDALKQYEALAKAAYDAGRATNLDRLAVKARRLEVEIWLEQAKSKAAK